MLGVADPVVSTHSWPSAGCRTEADRDRRNDHSDPMWDSGTSPGALGRPRRSGHQPLRDLVGVSPSCDRCDLQLDAPFDGPFWLRVPEQVYIAIAVWIARSADNNTVA